MSKINATRFLKYGLWLGFMAAMIGASLFYWRYEALYPETNNAYLRANVIHVAPQVAGKVQSVSIVENQHVSKGQPLFTIDPAPFVLAVQKAQANLQNTIQNVHALEMNVQVANAQLEKAQADLTINTKNADRIMSLVRKGKASTQEGDTINASLEVAKANYQAAQKEVERAQTLLGQLGDNNAQIQVARAELAQAKLNLSYTRVEAPASGIVTQVTLREGDTVNPNTPQFSLVEDGSWWVDANFKETALAHIQPQQQAEIQVDMYPGVAFKGVVESISPGSGAAFSLLPPENATGNWVKVTQRFPVRIRITQLDNKHPLRIGASCRATVSAAS